MELLKFAKQGLYLNFGIDDSNRLLILDVSDSADKELLEESRFFSALELHTTGSNPDDHHGAKHTGGNDLYYKEHFENDNEICFVLENENISAKLVYDFFENTKAVRVHSEITNVSKDNIGLEYVSLFCLYGINPPQIYLPHNAWCRELDWKEYTPSELGYNKINSFSTKRIAISNTGTWSSKEYLPMGMIAEEKQTIFWQIEHNGSWSWEISDIADKMYLKLSGPSEQENGWWKELKPNETFKTVSATVVFTSGDLSDAVAEMTKYRRKIAYRSKSDRHLPVIFNDYLNCLGADPTTEKELPVIDKAAEAGAEIFCMDAGWYADGTWWETVGEWEVCQKRFPNGMKEVFDYIRAKGMTPGIWLEPESIGIKCPILDRFDDSCFFMRHGKRVIDHGRYHFDFRNKQVTNFLDSVVDRLIKEYGIGYFKFDYNIDGGLGTELDADSFGDGAMQHNRAYLKWLDGIYERHPDLIIESCASGGMRMDYKTLQHCSLQSLTDAENCIDISPIAAMSQLAVIPEQAAVWCIPEKEDSLDKVAMNMVSAMFKRVHLSGKTPWLSDEQFKVLHEGVDFYKSIRENIPNMTAFYPIGLCDFNSDWVVVGYTDNENTFICATHINGDDELYIPFDKTINEANIVYPIKNTAHIESCDMGLKLTLQKKCAVVVKIN